MGLFKSNVGKIITELRKITEYYSNDLSKDIDESLSELKSDYEENSTAVPEFLEFVAELKEKLDKKDASRLEAFTSRLAKLNRSAKNGVEAMYQLSRNQRRTTSENLRYYEEYEV